VQPQELAFKVVADAYSTKQLRLINRDPNHAMAFKIKTTNPKQYFVRPNQGIVPKNDRMVIHVMMGKVSEVPKERCKDRFLVQSAPYDGVVPNEKFEWKSHFTDPNHKPHEIKLKCSYITQDTPEPPDTSTSKSVINEKPGLQQRRPVAKETVVATPTPGASTAPKVEKEKPAAGGAAKITPINPPNAKSGGPQYSIFLVVALMFFFIGRYTTHVSIPGLE